MRYAIVFQRCDPVRQFYNEWVGRKDCYGATIIRMTKARSKVKKTPLYIIHYKGGLISYLRYKKVCAGFAKIYIERRRKSKWKK